MDNLFNNPTLFGKLAQKGFFASGTLRKNFGVPEHLRDNQAPKGEHYVGVYCDFQRSVPSRMYCITFTDNKVVYFLTTFPYGFVFVNGGTKNKRRLDCIHDYNAKMNGVDRADQVNGTRSSKIIRQSWLGLYSVYIRSVKWWKRIFAFVIDVAVANSYTCYITVRKNAMDARPCLERTDFVEVHIKGLILISIFRN